MKRKDTPFRNGKGALLLIASLLFCSAILRVGVGAGQAVATENPFKQVRADTSNAAQEAETQNAFVNAEMLAAFQERDARLTERERYIEERAKTLSVADEEIERRLQALAEAERTLRDMLALADTAAEEDVSQLTSVYENMKPKNAAALFEEMEPAFAAGFLGRMKPASAAGIMANLSPQTAYTISVLLAGRNAAVPKEE